MKATTKELHFLSAWAREEKSADPYSLPAHRLQARHQVPGVKLIRAIKRWARDEGRCDEDIFSLFNDPNPSWPWTSNEETLQRLEAIAEELQV